MILDVSGPIGAVHASVPLSTPLDERHYVKLKYLHLPELPLLDGFTGALTVNSESFDVPSVNSIEALVNVLDNLKQAASRVCYVWYSGHEFEICAGTQNITLSAEFATLLKLPTTLNASQCYSTSIFEKSVSVYSHYAVVVRGCVGMWDGQGFDEVIAKVKRDGVIDAHPHYLSALLTGLEVEVYAVTRLGVVAEYESDEIWSLGLEFGDGKS